LKLRDFAIVGAVVLIAVFAVLDGLRSSGSTPTPPPPEEQSRTDGRRAEAEFRGARAAERFPPVRAGGRIVFTDPGECRVRAVTAGTGAELRLRRLLGNCELAGPRTGSTIAYGVEAEGDAASTFADVVGRTRGEWVYPVAPAAVVWSDGGRRAAWCAESESGFELEVAARVLRRLDGCPLAYAPGEEPTFARGQNLVVGERTLLRAASRVDYASWAGNGSLVLVIHEGRVARWADGVVTRTLVLPPALSGQRPILSPDNCAALFVSGGQVRLVDLGCFRDRGAFVTISPDNCGARREEQTRDCLRSPTPRAFPGTAAAWSPDGRWIAVADEGTIAFHRVVGRYDTVRWRAPAAQLVWQADA
jgi:WD40-like Beta Propeller Repeat